MLLVADTSPIISLLIVKQFDVLVKLFPDFKISQAVWEELISHNEISPFQEQIGLLYNRVSKTTYQFSISGIDRGETESFLLYKELNADFLLIDDKKGRQVAELMDVKCIGTLGLLYLAKENGLINQLRPLFETFILKNRYFSKQYINIFLKKANESPL